MPAGPETALAELLARAARERPEHVAVVETHRGSAPRSLTWAGLDEEASRVAGGLHDQGVVAGRRVVLACVNRLEIVVAHLGVLRAQAVSVPLNPLSTPGEVARVLRDCGARLVVADPTALPAVRTAVDLLAEHPGGAGPVPCVVVVGGEPATDRSELAWEALREREPRPLPALRDPEMLACLLYTSGTSGRPRAAMLSHRAIAANLRQLADVEPPSTLADDVVLGVLPLFHVYGLGVVLGGVLWHGATLVLAERFHPEETLALVAEHGCTVLPLAPAVFAQWRGVDGLAERLAGVRLVLSGSASLEPDAARAFADATGLVIHEGYGLTEAAPVVTSTLGSRRAVPGSVGAPLPGVEVRLVDERGRTPEPGDAGVVEVRGDNLFSGYWPDGGDAPGPDGWWSTGDVGFLEGTDLVLVDRVRELVVVSGFNVFPVEVEAVLTEVDGVREAAVVGVPDPLTGEAVVAWVAAPGLEPDAVERAVTAHAADRLARFKRPVRVEVVDRLPTTVTGKVQKGRLREAERRRAQGLGAGLLT